jgi:hypothetical protein
MPIGFYQIVDLGLSGIKLQSSKLEVTFINRLTMLHFLRTNVKKFTEYPRYIYVEA